MAKTASKILSWDANKESYRLIDQEKPDETMLHTSSQAWLDWLGTHKAFSFQGKNGHLNVQKENRPRSQEGYWYAYQRQGKRMVKQYLGRSSDISTERLESAAQNLAAKALARARQSTAPEDMVQESQVVVTSKHPDGSQSTTSLLVLTEPGNLVVQSPEPLLEPKLRLPRLHRSIISRPHLLDRLDEGLERKLTLVSAPAGFGKTTLVRHWLADRYEGYVTPQGEIPNIAWVSLDQGDNDPVRFWRYIIRACQASGIIIGQTALEQLIIPFQPSYHPMSLQLVLVSILNELTQFGGLNILVLEDYHVITSLQLHETMAFFVENLPSNVHLIIITRFDPPLPLARLRAQGELNEIHLASLRFSVEETWKFLQENSSAPISEETVQQLDRHLEGWAAGLRLLTMAVQNSQNQSRFEHLLQTFATSHRPIQEYFVTEVLNILPDQLQNFVLHTSILERLTPSLCNALTGEDNSDKWLEILEKSNLFLEPLDGSGEWYRYHGLFAGAMQYELRRRFGSAILAELYNRASQWFEQNNLFPDAVETALRANNSEEAARLIEKSIGDTHSVGLKFFQETNEFYTMNRWLKELPTAILRQHPLLCLNYASALFFISVIEFSILQPEALAQVQEVLNWAEEGWQDENQRSQLAQIFAFRALLNSMNGNLEEAIEWAKKALEGLPDEEQPWRGMVLNVLGSYELHKGQIDRAKRYLNEARINTDALGNGNFMRANMGLLAWAYADQGELNQAAEYVKLLLAEARELNDKDDIIHSLLNMADLYYEWNDLEIAWQQAQEVIELIPSGHLDPDWVEATLIQIQILHVRGETTQAQQRLNHLLGLVKPSASVVDYQQYRKVRLVQAQFHLENGNLAGFERWANTLNPDKVALAEKELEVYPVQRVKEMLLVARFLTGQEEWDKALALLEPLLTEMEAAGRFRYAMKTRLQMALALAAGKKLPEARQQVQIVLSQAHIEGFRRLFLDEGEPMANLLRATTLPVGGKALNQYRQQILQAFDQIHHPALPRPTAELLSPQEQKVLSLLKEGLSYPEIARQLVVSLNTIKTQVKSIYQKLNVNSRQQAIEVTRQLNLL